MARYTVYLTTTASLSVDVEVDDDLSPEEARDAAIEAAYEEAPGSVCAGCSGYGQDFSLDLGDNWELEDGPNAVERKD